jgi:hypothetical protein
MAKLTSGRCRHCQGQKMHAIVYQWKAGKGRRLFNAICPRCNNELEQTCVPNMKTKIIMQAEPKFIPRSWDGHTCDGVDDDDRPLKPKRVTCGDCGREWCERCDPCPSALCHWCHGRGYSLAPLELEALS